MIQNRTAKAYQKRQEVAVVTVVADEGARNSCEMRVGTVGQTFWVAVCKWVERGPLRVVYSCRVQ
jgi:hypothetical protein